MDATAKKKIAEYEMKKILGKGAYAVVKLAEHKKTKRKVAIKIYPKFKLNDAQKKKTVKSEIKSMEKLDHPYICKLYDHFESSKEIYLVQEYVPGISFFAFMRNRGLKKLPLD